jgi:hypothetical protein
MATSGLDIGKSSLKKRSGLKISAHFTGHPYRRAADTGKTGFRGIKQAAVALVMSLQINVSPE